MKLFNRLFVFFVLTFSCFAMAEWEDCPRELLDVPAMLQTAQGVTLEKYPDANTVVLDDRTYVRYVEDGRSFSVNDFAVKILTEKGRVDESTVGLAYSAAYEKDAFHMIRLYKANGEIVDINLEEAVSEQVNTGQMDSNIYDPNHKNLTASVAGLEVGDVLRVIYSEEITHPRVPNAYYGLWYLQHSSPICHMSVEIVGPSSLPLRSIAVKNKTEKGVEHKLDRLGETNRYFWETTDVPQLINEPSMPAFRRCVQRLLVSSFAGWDEVATWYWNLCNKHYNSNPAMEEKVKELVADCPDDMSKIRSIFKFVSQDIRYMGVTVETEAPGYEPHDATMTFDNRHGVCRDKAALLAAMLRQAGFDAMTVLIFAGSRLDEEVPLPYFNHAITAVRNEDGTYILMDSTNENTKDLLPNYLANNSYLVAREGETLRTTPVIPAANNQVVISTTGKMDENGVALLTSRVDFNGVTDISYRTNFLRRTPDERQQFLQRLLNGTYPNLKLLNYQIYPQDLQDTNQPLCVILQYSMADVMIEGSDAKEGRAIFMAPQLADIFGKTHTLVNKWNCSLDKRKYILQVWTTGAFVEDLSLEVPCEYTYFVDKPNYLPVSNDKLVWQKEFNVEPCKISMHYEMSVNDLEWTPAEYQELKRQMADIAVNARKHLLIKKTPTLADLQAAATASEEAEVKTPDAEVLEKSITFEIQPGGREWTKTEYRKMRILTYNGMKDCGEITRYFNAGWDDVKVEFARVANGDVVQEASEAEINLMDSAWVSSAPRYTPEKVLVVSLPGVQVGSVIEYKLVSKYTGRPFFCYEGGMAEVYPVGHGEINVIADEDYDFEAGWYPRGFLGMGNANVTSHENSFKLNDGRVKYTWSCEDIPAYYQEDHMPPLTMWSPALFISAGTYREYARLIQSRYDAFLPEGSNMDALINLVKTVPREEQLEKLMTTVERLVRRVPVSFVDMPLDNLTSPERTLADGYGNDGDKGLVMYVAAKRLGFKPEICLVCYNCGYDARRQLLAKYPMPHRFGGFRVRVKNYNGGEVWLNDCGQYGMIQSCSFPDNIMLNVSNGKVEKPATADEYLSAVRRNVIYEIQADGTAVITLKESYHGFNREHLRHFYMQATPEVLRRNYLEAVSVISPNAIPITPEMIYDVESYPATTEFTVKVPNWAVVDGDFMYFRINNGLQAENCPDGRRNPFLIGNFFQRESTISLRLPSEFSDIQICPPEFLWKSPAGKSEYVFEYLTDPRKYSGELRMRSRSLRNSEIMGLDKYKSLQELQRMVNGEKSSMFLLRRRKN